ncbi:MAG: O-antigen ligase family protein [Ardenticatenia bacterium]|nr:O-antigen ligase family protein [Ardenticatenia bacterium]
MLADFPATNVFLSLLLLVVTALLLPFEIVRPTLGVGPLAVTNVEVVVGAFILSVAVARPRWQPRLADGALVLFLGGALLSALLAPAYRPEALKFALRLAAGAAFMGAVAAFLRTTWSWRLLLWACVAGGVVSALVGLGEVAGWAPLGPWLALFKEGPSRVGGVLRLSGSFQYATIASAYFEMVWPLAAVLAATERGQGRVAALGAVGLLSVAVALTLTRSGMATVLLTAVALGVLASTRRHTKALLLPAGVAMVSMGASVALLAWNSPTVRARFTTENDLTWYGARYTVPAAVRVRAGDVVTLTVEVENTGAATWTPAGESAFALGTYWRRAEDGAVLDMPHAEWPLPGPVAPGERVRLHVAVPVDLPPGTYRLTWGMLQRQILWFRHRGVLEAFTLVEVEGEGRGTPAHPAPKSPEPQPTVPPTVARRDLWRAALAMWRERPLLGHGPDTFRQRYGSYLGLPAWDRRLHANNLYLELLSGVGLVGLAGFAAFVLASGRDLWRSWRHAMPDEATLAAGVVAGVLAFTVHGLLDAFLGFTPTASLFWLLLGVGRALVERGERARVGAGNQLRLVARA